MTKTTFELILISIILAVACILASSCQQRTILEGQGPQGVPGANAAPCNVSQQPQGALITCPDGSSSLVLNGTNGAVGATGPAGQDGTPGTIITPIQFCSASQTSYPSTFTESGFCLNGQIYGVYSANGGFLALLPPGQYSSNGINASCTFTIGDNCQVVSQ